MKANCLIIDDEPVARDILRKYIKDVPGLELAGECRDAFEATSQLSENKIDILFLDINMPRLSGLTFAKSLVNSPMIIFTTAYPEYAVDGFELDAVDYLVKPFSFERFLKAVNRASEKIESTSAQIKEASILLRSDKKIYSVKLSDIECIEGCGDYIKVCLSEGKNLIVHDTIKSFISSLPETEFMRVHKSFAVRLDCIKYLEGNIIHFNEREVPFSPTYRQELLERLK